TADYDDLMEKTLPFDWKSVLPGGKDSVITNPRDPNFVGKHGDSIIFTIADTVSTEDWYLLIKAGAFMTAGTAEPRYNWLLDELILWDMTEPLPATAIKSVAKSTEILITPNPVSGNTLRISGYAGMALSYRIYDLSGKVILEGKTIDHTIAIDKLKAGLYSLVLVDGQQVITSKFVKQ
ncbi:MAG: T9SS type A sorting domain-containing protein, partial [Bacteroidales bacterium]